MNTLKFNQIEFNHIGEQPSMPLQEKSVTITENGITEIVPDSGYALEKVEVKVDTPKKERYYHVELDETDSCLDHFMLYSLFYSSVKTINHNTGIITIGEVKNFTISDVPDIIGFSINCDILLGTLGGQLISGRYIAENLPTFPRTEITKEEYYTIS